MFGHQGAGLGTGQLMQRKLFHSVIKALGPLIYASGFWKIKAQSRLRFATFPECKRVCWLITENSIKIRAEVFVGEQMTKRWLSCDLTDVITA